MEDLYEKTIERSEKLKKAGYNLIEMWECEWTK
jgi:G:T-mismatch repair DNA endonuclease (very short patch repair protein)